MSKDKSKNNADQREANCRISKQLVIDGCVYWVHPIYNLYAASRDGKIIELVFSEETTKKLLQ